MYFDVEAYGVARYCAFASLSLPPTHEVADDEADAASTRVHKRSGRDFVLWRSLRSAAADQAGAVWSSPWGDGRPGWHIECSAVCEAHFGANLDVRTATLRVAIPRHAPTAAPTAVRLRVSRACDDYCGTAKEWKGMGREGVLQVGGIGASL